MKCPYELMCLPLKNWDSAQAPYVVEIERETDQLFEFLAYTKLSMRYTATTTTEANAKALRSRTDETIIQVPPNKIARNVYNIAYYEGAGPITQTTLDTLYSIPADTLVVRCNIHNVLSIDTISAMTKCFTVAWAQDDIILTLHKE